MRVRLPAIYLILFFAISALVAQALQAQSKLPAFEVATIKPSNPNSTDHAWDSSVNRISIHRYTLRQLIEVAYRVKHGTPIKGGPKWQAKNYYDIEAKISDDELAKMDGMSAQEKDDQPMLMLQNLLAERFHLKVHRSPQTVQVLALVVATPNTTLTRPQEGGHQHLSIRNGRMSATSVPMDSLADFLATQPESDNRVVLNRTGLSGAFNFTLNWTPDRGNGIAADSTYPGLSTALQDQLGLKLKPEKASVEAVTVDSAAEPIFD